jgi:glutaredoxin
MPKEFFLKIIKCRFTSTENQLIYSSPLPYVVELDKHPHGQELQSYLGEVTGRRTVPNIMVDGVSIGGGDQMRALEAAGTVAETLLSGLAGRITIDGKSTP